MINCRVGLIALLSLALLGAPERASLAPEPPDVGPPKVTGPQEVEVVAVLIDQRTQQPTVLLQGKRDKRSLSMAIGRASCREREVGLGAGGAVAEADDRAAGSEVGDA